MATFQEFLKFNSVNPQKALKLMNSRETPTLLAFESTNGPVTIPVWSYFHENKFYLFSGKTSKKVQAIEVGKNKVGLTFLNSQGYPIPLPGDLNYFGLRGTAKIVSHEDIPNLDEIHLELLSKYDPYEEEEWVNELRNKIAIKPEAVWLIQITPTNYFTG